ncbi:MAG: hypothetical protein RL187_181 [Actinomycetota bacterium]
MAVHTPNSTHSFSRLTTWVGIILLGAGLVAGVPSRGDASSPGPLTSSVEWSGVDHNQGWLSGGTAREFINGTRGWQAEAFDRLGDMGIEWTSSTQGTQRTAFSGEAGSSSLSPGGTSTWNTAGYLSVEPANQIYTETQFSISGSQARFVMNHQSLGDIPSSQRRIYWTAALASGYSPIYSGQAGTTLLISDANGLHPTLVISASATAGQLSFGGGASRATSLTNGDLSPTVYFTPGTADNSTVTVTVGIIDADPCSSEAALALATTGAGVFGTAWEPLTSCLRDVSWSATSDGEPSEILTLDFAQGYQVSSETNRSLLVTGLPEGVELTIEEDASTSLAVRLRVDASVAEGDYPLVFSVTETFTTNGVSFTGKVSRSSGTLSITPPAPPEIAPEEVEADPLDSPAEVSVSNSEVVIQPLILEASEVQVPPAASSAEFSSPSLQDVVDQAPSPAIDPEPSVREARPQPLLTEIIPEPLGAGAWLGLGTAALAGGGIFAALRRKRREPSHREAGDSPVGLPHHRL